MNYVTFDIETYHPSRLEEFNVDKFRVSVIGAYISWIDEYLAFTEENVKDFLNVLLDADMVVGYNHIWFDLAVLQKYSQVDLVKNTNNYDIMLEVEKKLGFKMKLDDLCKANFDTDKKTDHYEQFKEYYWDKEWFKLIDYCMNDVRLTEQLFRQIRDTGTVKYRDFQGVKEVGLDQPQVRQIIRDEVIMDSIF